MAKVYCSECLFFIEGEEIPHPFGPPEYIKERCTSPSNFKDNHKEPLKREISTPRIINRSNDCPWFEQKSSSSSSSSSGSSSSSL